MGLTQIAINFIEMLGYGGLAIGLIVDSMGVPIPSEVLIPLAAVLAKQGSFNLVAVLVISTVAQVIGGVIAYEIGRRGGVRLIRHYGYYVLLSEHDLEITEGWFERYGRGIALVGRCLPVIRGYIGFVAGVGKMPRPQFIIYTTIGSLAWTLILAALGWKLADHVESIDAALKPFTLLIIGIILVAVIWFVASRWSQREELKTTAKLARKAK